MKMRTRGSSIRLRLTRAEVAALATLPRCSVEERIVFGPRAEDVLTYALVASESARRISARLEESGRRIVVEVPLDAARQWAESEQVGLEATQPTHATAPDGGERGEARSLSIVIEKDFACLAPRPGDDDVDTFAHPNAGKPGSRC